MEDTLYIQIDRNIRITSPQVTLGEIAKLYCTNQKILKRCRSICIYEVPNGNPGRYVVNAIDVIEIVQKQEESLQITHLGEPVFLLTYEKRNTQSPIWQWCKVAFVCVIIFFGAGLSIMTFNMDADMTKLFANMYQNVTGRPSDGMTVMELMYSLGVGAGVIFFFNHFGGKKITEDPTPIQVQMRTYEDDVDKTVMEIEGRSKENENE